VLKQDRDPERVVGPQESKEPGAFYEWTLTMLRFLSRARDLQKQPANTGRGREERGIGNLNFSAARASAIAKSPDCQACASTAVCALASGVGWASAADLAVAAFSIASTTAF
jgi:hypothetical protein